MIKRILCVVGLALVLTDCSNISVQNPTDKFLSGKRLALLDNKKLKEISGADASKYNPGYFWVHNDSGNSAEVYLVDSDLNIMLTCTLDKIENRDWEDLAIGPGPKAGKTYMYVGEIGDNLAQFPEKKIYRMEEPRWDGKTKSISITAFDTITFQLDTQKDAETLLLDPSSKDLYLISKREEPVWLYRLKYPQSTSELVTAEKVMSIPLTQIVGGDVSDDGKRIILKNYEHLYFWEAKSSTSLTELLKERPFEVPYIIEPQGEAIMWSADNSGFYTISEINKGKDSYLYFYKEKK